MAIAGVAVGFLLNVSAAMISPSYQPYVVRWGWFIVVICFGGYLAQLTPSRALISGSWLRTGSRVLWIVSCSILVLLYGVGAYWGVNALWDKLLYIPKPSMDKTERHKPDVSPAPGPPDSPHAPQFAATPPRVDIGFGLGAEYVTDGNTECGHGKLVCYSEREVRGRQIFDLGLNPYHTIIYRFRDLGDQKLINPHFHVEASNTGVQIYQGHDRSVRQALYVLESSGGEDVMPYRITKSYYAWPVDVVVPENIMTFDITFGVFGDNMPMHKLIAHFSVNH